MRDVLTTRHTAEAPPVAGPGRREAARRRREFKQHLFVYALVNGALWAMWVVVGIVDGFGFLFPIFPTVLWGVGLLIHGWTVYRPHAREEDRAPRETDGPMR